MGDFFDFMSGFADNPFIDFIHSLGDTPSVVQPVAQAAVIPAVAAAQPAVIPAVAAAQRRF